MSRPQIFSAIIFFLVTVNSAYAANPISAFEGQRLFVSHCQLCHGPQGKGDGPLAKNLGLTPTDLTRTIRSRSDTILKKIISGQGKPTISGRDRHNVLTQAMPSWEEVLTESQIESLIAFLRYLGTAKYELMGDPQRGFGLYQKFCAVCHGEEGYGDGVMTEIMDVEPLDHTNPVVMNRLSNEELVAAILEGDGGYMPAWQGLLDMNDVEALVSYIRLLTQ